MRVSSLILFTKKKKKSSLILQRFNQKNNEDCVMSCDMGVGSQKLKTNIKIEIHENNEVGNSNSL